MKLAIDLIEGEIKRFGQNCIIVMSHKILADRRRSSKDICKGHLII